MQMLFLDFSPALNTIISQHLIGKLELLGFSAPVHNWLLDFLMDRPQSTCVSKNTSSVISLSTGSTQGCVLSPLLFTLLTHHCVLKSATNQKVKFADNTTLVGLIRDNNLARREEVEQLRDDVKSTIRSKCQQDQRGHCGLQEDPAQPQLSAH